MRIDESREMDSASRRTFRKLSEQAIDLSNIVGSGSGSRKNLLDNGAMTVAQRAERGGSITGVTTDAGQRLLDRWLPRNSALGTYTYSSIADGPANTEFWACHEMKCTTADAAPAAGDLLILQEAIEGYDIQHLLWGTASAKPVTLSFWVKANTTGTFIAELYRNEASIRTISATYTINAANTWEYKTITYPGDTTTVTTADNNTRLVLVLWLAGGSTYTGGGALQTSWGNVTNNLRDVGQTNLSATVNNFIRFTGVQLEVGSVATAFDTRSFVDELARCQRYAFYPGYNTPQGNYVWLGTSLHLTAILGIANLSFPVPMRALPALDMNGSVVGSYALFDRVGGQINATALAADNVVSTSSGLVQVSVAGALTVNYGHFAKIAGQVGGLGWSADI